MNGILMKPDIWTAKQKVLEQYGLAVTRRLDNLKEINKEPDGWEYKRTLSDGRSLFWATDIMMPDQCLIKPRYHTGEVVYVKEAWAYGADRQQPKGIIYKLDGTPLPTALQRGSYGAGFAWGKWASPMFLKAIYARTFLEIVSVRPELFRIKNLSLQELALEGGDLALIYLQEYDGKWVWRIEFKPAARPEDLR